MQSAKILFLAAACSFFAVNCAFAQTNWVQTSAPSNAWFCVASSADGSKLAAAMQPGSIYTSPDSGVTWTQALTLDYNGNPVYWQSIASSADGNTLFAVSDFDGRGRGMVYSSTNAGVAWQTNTIRVLGLSSNWKPRIACSADGTKAVTVYYGMIYSTTNSGASWISNNIPTNTFGPDSDWYSVICSPDGNQFIASGTTNTSPPLTRDFEYVSTNAGSTWTIVSSSLALLARSADGRVQIGCLMNQFNFNTGPMYVSTNSGATWSTNNFQNDGWAMSVDGRIMVSTSIHVINTTTNFGATWQSTTTYTDSVFEGAASSADGNKLVALDAHVDISGGPIWTLYNTPTPSLNVTPANGNLTLSWIIPSTNFVLQSSSDLASWTDVTNQPALNLTNLQNQVSLPPSGSNVFFRLKTP